MILLKFKFNEILNLMRKKLPLMKSSEKTIQQQIMTTAISMKKNDAIDHDQS